jgi:GNAT superfamily N-acetyltransferase
VREVRTPVPRRGGTNARLLHLERDSARLREFLGEIWAREDPYRVFDSPMEWLASDLDRSLGRLAEPTGAIAEEDGRVVGAVLLERPFDDGDAPVLSWLSVRWGYRCDGVGSALLAAIVEELGRTGTSHVASAASPGNTASLYWHWRNGFHARPDPVARFGWGARRR